MAEKIITIKERLLGLVDALLEDNDTIPDIYRPIVKKLIKNYLAKADPAQIEELLKRVQAEVIPFVLTGTIPDDNDKHSQ
jgi:hypothetical protein